MKNKSINVVFLAMILTTSSCEIDTKLAIKGGNPPTFLMSGNGTLTSLRVRGHKKQREAQGEDASLYWVINSGDYGQVVDHLGSVTYGKIPKGYWQKYPEKGDAPQLEEGQRYYIRAVTMDANGDDGYFMIINGKAIFAKYEYELPEESKVVK